MPKKKRRSRGDGSVYQRGDGYWVAKYEAVLPDGSTKTKRLYARTRPLAAEKLRAALAERHSGTAADDGGLTVEKYLARWLGGVRDTVKHRTWMRHEEVVRLHLSPLGTVRLGRLDAPRVQNLYRAKLDEGLSTRTVRIIHATLHKALKQAVRWRLLAHNVAEDVDPPKAAGDEIRPLSAAQAGTLLDTVRGDRLEALYVIALTTGMRKGELLGLQWGDIELDEGVARVRRTYWEGRTYEPKTAAAKRQVALPGRARAALAGHLQRRQVDAPWVFVSRAGTPLAANNIHRRSWKPLLAKAGLPEATRFHDLRHTCATLLLGRGVHPKLVQSLLGHASIEITLNTYSHVLPEMGNAAVRAMDDALGV